MAPDYVRLTFTPAGAARPRTIWAERGRERNGVVSFWRVDRHGERPDPEELIMARTTECRVRPAQMNLKYAELEITPVCLTQ
jgi:hypothetical protein